MRGNLRIIALLTIAFLGCPTSALGQHAPKAAASQPSTSDALGEVALYFNEYATRVTAKDLAWLKAHVSFPLPTEELKDDGTGDVARKKIKSAKDLLRAKGLLGESFTSFWKRVWSSKDWVAAKAGETGDCDAKDSTKWINWTKGPSAFYVKGTTAEIVHYDSPCGNLSDYNRFLLKKTPSGWRLIAMKLGLRKK